MLYSWQTAPTCPRQSNKRMQSLRLDNKLHWKAIGELIFVWGWKMLTELPDTTMHQQNGYVQYTFSGQWFYKYLQLQNQNYLLHTLQQGGGDQIAPVFKVFDTSSKLFPSCQPAPDLSPRSSFVSNLSSRFLPLLQICPKFFHLSGSPASDLS